MAGSGKSTVGRLVAEHFSKSMHIQVDQLREMMVKGIDVPNAEGFTEGTYQQFQWARSTTIYMAQLYASQGVDVVIDDVCVPPNFAEQYGVPGFTISQSACSHRTDEKASWTMGSYLS